MALFIMIIRKMLQNKWLVSSMFFGLLVTIALVGTIPIYSEAILSRMLVKDLEEFQKDRGIYPGSHWTQVGFYNETIEEREQIVAQMDRYMAQDAALGFGIPVKELVREQRTKAVSVSPAIEVSDNPAKLMGSIRTYSEFEDHITLIDGRWPAKEPVEGIYEVMVTERALTHFRAVLGAVLHLNDDRIKETIKVKLVGVFTKKELDDPYFRNTTLSDLNSALIIDDSLFKKEFLQGGLIPVAAVGWFFVLDYSKMELSNVNPFIDTDKAIREMVRGKIIQFQSDFSVPALVTLSEYFDRAKQLNKLLWSLQVPVLIMLGLYMFMVSNLIVDRQKTEIAVLRSRGAARWQVVLSFAVEGLLLCFAAWLAGPVIGLGLTKILGASNGFLEFIERSRMPVHLNSKAYLYGGAAAAVSFMMMLIPVLMATRVTIIGHKQQLARIQRTPIWHKAFLDIVALAVSLYGLYTFRSRLKDIRNLGLNTDDLQIDPLQFVMPALFVLGAGLLLLRLYPYALKLIYWVGRQWWPPSLYATLIQVGRSNRQYQFLMVFLIMTIAVGVFSAGAARTLNANTEERIRYSNGADFVMSARWVNDAPPPPLPGESNPTVGNNGPIHYLEPPIEPYVELPGVAHAAKVFVKEQAFFTMGTDSGAATVMGIDTDEFGEASWFPDGLLDHHFYDYLNLMAGDARAVLISKTLADQRGVKKGDTIYVGWNDVSAQPFVVYGVIDYFPTFNPNPPIGSVDAADDKAKNNAPMLIVGHLSRIQFQLALEPYQVWLKMKPGYSTSEFYDGIQEARLPIERMINTKEQLNKAKNDPFLLALNGILTLGFIISILICFIGFLLYWILSLKGRTLQNGMMRAIGLSFRQLIGMLALEQLLTSGVAIMIGAAVGHVASRLFVPNFQIAFNQSSLVPPFKVIFEATDFIRLYSIVVFMLILGLGILSYMLSRIRIHQALKLGED